MGILDIFKPAKYCYECGGKIIEIEYIVKYDKITGKPIIKKMKVCEKDHQHMQYRDM